MLITNIPKSFDLDTVRYNLAMIGVRHSVRVVISAGPSSRSLNFKLEFDRVADPCEHTRRKSASGRRTTGVTWEACRRVLADLFDRYPDVTVKTAIITYRGKADFEAKYAATYHHNAGNRYNPVAFGTL